ncbi:antibiotic biosynthesis monooxygenase family protein [Nocardioides montaniterrae]
MRIILKHRIAGVKPTARVSPVLVVNRFRVPTSATDGGDALRGELESVHALLAEKQGYVDGALGRNLDEPDLWVLTTRWENVGAYRRALSSYDLKMYGVPVLSRAIDEPGAYEVVEPGTVLNVADSRIT